MERINVNDVKENLERIALMNIVWCKLVFPDGLDEDGKPREDCYDDMVAHIIIGKWRFCIDITKETDKAVREARKYVLKKLFEAVEAWHLNMSITRSPKTYF